MKTLIVIPTYNEIENIKKLVGEIFQQVDPNTHLLIIDDNSPDGTGDLIDVLTQSNARVHVIHRPRKMGLGTAYVAGFRYALENEYDVVFEMDSDFSHDPKYLPVFQHAIETSDAVIGSRYVPGGGVLNWGLARKILSQGGSTYARWILDIPIYDLTGGFNCWKKEVIAAIGPNTLKSDGYAFQIEMKYKAYKNGFRVKEIPIVFEDRYLGQSKMSKKIILEAIWRVFLMRLQNTAFRKLLPVLMLFLCALNVNAAFSHDPFAVVMIDKSVNKIYLVKYLSEQIAVEKSFHATLGKILGDKEIEKDLKTPEGIYFFKAKLTPPGLKKKFGKMALMMDYPNPIDQQDGKTGYDIMLHATNEPERLKRDLDSEGCVVVSNEQIEEISDFVKLGLTPIIIYPTLKDEYLKPNLKPELQQTFWSWIKAWNNKDLETYIGMYTNQFVYNGMNLKQYRQHKNSLNQRYSKIYVEVKHPRFFYHPKYDLVTFTQIYKSELRGGRPGFRSSGTKLLYFLKNSQNGRYQIASEGFTTIREK